MREIESNYYWYDVVGDGHCFINCILEVFSAEYRQLKNKYSGSDLINKRLNFVRKLRCDIANTLISESDKTMGQIHSRLAFLNPTTMSKYFYIRDEIDDDGSPKSSYEELNMISSLYKLEGESSIDDLYEYLATKLIFRDGREITALNVKELYESDFRLHEAGDNPSEYGVGDYSPTIKFYELCTNITGYDDDIKSIIENLIDGDSFIEYRTSVIIANLLNINIVYFSVGGNYTNYDEILCNEHNAPYIFMINQNNLHWDLVGYKYGNGMIFTFSEPSETIKELLFKAINHRK